MKYALQVKDLTKNYKSASVLRGVNMNIPEGAIYGFVGKNGAGKTTLIRQICGLQQPTSGSYSLWGIENTNSEIISSRKRMGAIVESPALYKSLTAYQNMKLQYMNLGLPNYDGIDDLLKLVGLGDTDRKKVKNFSLGMRQRLAIAVALCGKPDFIILDEPINGLDPQGIIEIRELILKLNREFKITILISSHILDELSRIATHYGFLDNGRIVREMTAEELAHECRKSVRMKVSDTKVLSKIMEARGIEYKVIDDSTADVFSQLTFSEIAKAFADEGAEIISMEEHDESLEAFYLSLIGGSNEK